MGWVVDFFFLSSKYLRFRFWHPSHHVARSSTKWGRGWGSACIVEHVEAGGNDEGS